MNEKTYTLAELISFGNYLLSEQRNKSVTNEQSETLLRGTSSILNASTHSYSTLLSCMATKTLTNALALAVATLSQLTN
jgi:hypothetical protein